MQKWGKALCHARAMCSGVLLDLEPWGASRTPQLGVVASKSQPIDTGLSPSVPRGSPAKLLAALAMVTKPREAKKSSSNPSLPPSAHPWPVFPRGLKPTPLPQRRFGPFSQMSALKTPSGIFSLSLTPMSCLWERGSKNSRKNIKKTGFGFVLLVCFLW
ncbi:hypothetical protein Nmel_016494, partial [Mimus melanotis]